MASQRCWPPDLAKPGQTWQTWPKLVRTGKRPIVLVSPQVRAGMKQMTSANLPRLIVMSFNEITRDTKVEIVGIVNDS